MRDLRPGDILRNEGALLWYSLRMLVGRNLLAVGIISAVMIGAVFTYTVPVRDTKFTVLLKQMEMFSPLLGIVVFSDLIAADVQAKRATLLMSSRYGIVPVVIRKLVHGLIITSGAYFVNLIILRVFYTSFDVVSAFWVLVPGALYYGMIGLLVATFTSHALAGYAAGASAMILSMVTERVMPFVPLAYAMKGKLSNGTLFGEHNWIFAKAAFVCLSAVLAVMVVLMVKNRARKVRTLVKTVGLLAVCYGAANLMWSIDPEADIHFSGSRQLELLESGDELVVRTATVQAWGSGRKKNNEEALLTDTIYKKQDDRWIMQQSAEYDSAKEYDLLHVDIDADVNPKSGEIEASSRADVKVLAEKLNKVYLRIAWELQIKKVSVGGERIVFQRYGDMVEVPLPETAEKGQTVQVQIEYGGNLLMPGGRHRTERRDEKVFFVNSRWYPFIKSWYHDGAREACSYDIRVTVPRQWEVGAGDVVSSDDATRTWRFGTDTPCDRIALLITRMPKYEAQCGDIKVTVYGHSMSAEYLAEIGERACDSLRYYESVFGKYPHQNLAIAEYDYIGAGGVAVPSIVLMNTGRCRKEHAASMLNTYVPHEVAHQWSSCAMPIWIAESLAIYSNYLYLLEADGDEAKLTEFKEGLLEMFENVKNEPVIARGSSGMLAYSKGGYLPMMLTELNKAETITAIGSFIKYYLKLQLADTDAADEVYIEALKGAAGAGRASFVNDWLETVELFDPAVAGLVQTKTEAGYKVTAKLEHRQKIRFAVPLELSFEDGTSYETVWDGVEKSEGLEWVFDKPVSSVRLDPDNELLDWDRFNNSLRVSGVSSGQVESAAVEDAGEEAISGWKVYTVADGLLGNNVRWLDVDGKGGVVAGYQLYSKKAGTVLQYFDGEKWSQPDMKSGSSGPLSAGAVASDGVYWAAVGGRLRRIDQKGMTVFTMSQVRDYRSLSVGKAILTANNKANTNIPGYVVYDMTAGDDGSVWLGTDNGISIVDAGGELVSHFTAADGLPGNEVLCMTRQGSDCVWVGTDKGCAVYNGVKWTVKPEIASGVVLSISVDSGGKVYVGTYRRGVVVYDGKDVRRIDSFNSCLPHNMVTAVVCDEDDRLWAGTGEGLLCIDGDQEKLYTKDNSGLLSNYISDLAVAGKDLYIATDKGIGRFDYR